MTEPPGGSSPPPPPEQPPQQPPDQQPPEQQHPDQQPDRTSPVPPAPYGPPQYPVPRYQQQDPQQPAAQPPYAQPQYQPAQYPPAQQPPAQQPPLNYPPPGQAAPVYPPQGWTGQGWAGQGWAGQGQQPAYQPQPPYQPPVSQPRPPYPHPEPREYHEMYRTWTYHWWRPVVGILLLVVGMLIVLPLLMLPVLVAGVLIENGQEDFFQAFLDAGTFQRLTPSGLLYLNLSLGGMILWTWGLVRVLHQMRPRWLSSVVPKLRWGYLFACFGVAVVALIAQVVVGLLVPQDANPDMNTAVNAVTGTTIALAIVILLTTPLQAAGEEYIFRGYLMQAVGSLSRRRWVALLVTATLFAMAHGFQNFPLFFDRFMFGLIAGWLVVRTGGLEAPIAMHVLNNYLAFGLALLFGDIGETLTVTEVSWWNIPVTLTQSIVFATLAAWVAKAMRLQRRTVVPERADAQEALL